MLEYGIFLLILVNRDMNEPSGSMLYKFLVVSKRILDCFLFTWLIFVILADKTTLSTLQQISTLGFQLLHQLLVLTDFESVQLVTHLFWEGV